MRPKCNPKILGTTLIELILTLILIAVALMGIYIATIRHGADPLIKAQAIAIAESYLTEILSKDFPAGAPCTVPDGGRSTYNNVCDYNSIGKPVPEPVQDQNGTIISGLENYFVNVDVLFNTYAGLSNNAVRIDVTVTNNAIGSMVFSGYKTNY